jgi:hypothetical protein
MSARSVNNEQVKISFSTFATKLSTIASLFAVLNASCNLRREKVLSARLFKEKNRDTPVRRQINNTNHPTSST